MMQEERREWERSHWEPPPPLPTGWIKTKRGGRTEICPYIGVPLPRTRDFRQFEYYLKFLWYSKRERSWDMPPLTRDAWFDFILEDWRTWDRRIRVDNTPRFKEQVRKLLDKGEGSGFVMVIGGNPSEQGDGKSIGGLMVCDLLTNEFSVDVIPNQLWEHSHMQIVLEDRETEWAILNIDEDLTATGEGSKNILIEIRNTKQTQRKTKLIIISIGVDPAHSDPSVNVHLIPCGINKRFQATRFAMMKRGKFKGWVVLQREYRPDMLVRYGTDQEMDTIDSYGHRAAYHSARVVSKGIQAIPREVREAHIETVMEWLELDRLRYEQAGQEWRPPAIDVMANEAIIACDLPAKTVSYPRGICSTALRRFQFENPGTKKGRTEEVDLSQVMLDTAEFWEDYQAIVYSNYPESYALADRDAWMVTYRTMGFTDPKTKEMLRLKIRVNSIGERIRKGVSDFKVLPSNTQLGTIGERFIGSRIESLGVAPCVYARSLDESARRDVPDISDTGLVRNATWAINVKVSMEDDFDRVFETSPEHEVRRSWCAFLFPRTGRMSICDIVGENTRHSLGGRGGMVLCGIDEGVQRLREMIDSV